MKQVMMTALIVICFAAMAVCAQEYNETVYPEADNVENNPDPAKAFEGPVNELPDLIQVQSNRPVDGDSKGCWPDPIADNAPMYWVVQYPTNGGDVKVRVEGRENVGAVFYVSVVPTADANGNNGTAADTVEWADVQDWTESDGLILHDKKSDCHVKDPDNDSPPPPPERLNCVAYDDGYGQVRFSLGADTGAYRWEIWELSSDGVEETLIAHADWPEADESPYTTDRGNLAPDIYRLKVQKENDNNFSRMIDFTVSRVEFVPAVTGVAEIPDVPQNAVLPTSLSGAGVANKVKMKLQVTGPDGAYDFELISEDTSKATISTSAVSVVVSGGSGTSSDIVVTGGALSSASSDAVKIKAQKPGGGRCCEEDFVRYKITTEVTKGTTEFVTDTQHTFNTAMKHNDGIKIVVPWGPTDATASHETPGGTEQDGGTTTFPDDANNLFTTSTIGTDGSGYSLYTMGSGTGDEDSGGPDDFTAAVGGDQNMELTFVTDPGGVAAGMGLEVDCDISARIVMNGAALTTNVIPSWASIGISFKCFSIAASASNAKAAIAGGNHGFVLKDPDGIWSPYPNGTVPGGDDMRAEAHLAPGSTATFDQTKSLEIDNLSIKVDTEKCFIKSSLATGSKRAKASLSDGVGRSYAKAFKTQCVLDTVSVTSLP